MREITEKVYPKSKYLFVIKKLDLGPFRISANELLASLVLKYINFKINSIRELNFLYTFVESTVLKEWQ